MTKDITGNTHLITIFSAISIRLHSRAGPECHIDRTSQHSVQITRNDGHQPEEPAGSISSAKKASKDKENDAKLG